MPAAPPPLFGNATEEGKFVMGLMTSFKVQLGRSDAVLYLAFDTGLNFTGDAIVNAANEGCVGGGGIDGEVNHRGGYVIEEARRALPPIGLETVVFCGFTMQEQTTIRNLVEQDL